ncbi:hypothetical protein D9613_006645 [Agrocybe pediades]|uniref:Uncharacterized protein n=1 Tax=Agrocybe pediades TaxID=84607 RepID=A0A8H4QHP5_9AGAR|nr:hypothetical protein D9613_006645 [Agrocybe pediades]
MPPRTPEFLTPRAPSNSSVMDNVSRIRICGIQGSLRFASASRPNNAFLEYSGQYIEKIEKLNGPGPDSIATSSLVRSHHDEFASTSSQPLQSTQEEVFDSIASWLKSRAATGTKCSMSVSFVILTLFTVQIRNFAVGQLNAKNVKAFTEIVVRRTGIDWSESAVLFAIYPRTLLDKAQARTAAFIGITPNVDWSKSPSWASGVRFQVWAKNRSIWCRRRGRPKARAEQEVKALFVKCSLY